MGELEKIVKSWEVGRMLKVACNLEIIMGLSGSFMLLPGGPQGFIRSESGADEWLPALGTQKVSRSGIERTV